MRVHDSVLWVALAHSAQYLWVTSYYARATQQWRGGALYAAKVAAAGVAAACFAFVELEVRLDRSIARKDWQEASNIFDRTRWLGRDSAKQRRRVARQLFAAQQPELAIANYERAIELDANASYLGELAFIQNANGEPEAALATYRRGLALEPNHPMLLLHLGQLGLSAGQPDSAVRTLEQLAELKPDWAEAQSALADAGG